MNAISKLDDIFLSHLLGNSTEKELCKDLAVVLNYKWGSRYDVSIADNTKREIEPFFGMRIFPGDDYSDQLLDESGPKKVRRFSDIWERWKRICVWTVELDSRLFDKQHFSFNQQELTAMMLHEMGHVVYSQRTLEVFYHAYMECKIRRNMATKAAAKTLYRLYAIPLFIACGIRRWTVTSDDLNEEFYADQSVSNVGYGEHLISAYEKIIKSCGNSSTVTKKPHDVVKESVLWCDKNISDLSRRKMYLVDEIYHTGARSSGNAIKRLCSTLLESLKFRKKEKYTGNIAQEYGVSLEVFADPEFIHENSLVCDMKEFGKIQSAIESLTHSMKMDIANEAFGRNKKPEIPSQLDVDTIFVEVDRIENHADRRYVLDLIYNQEEKIEHFKELFEYDKSLKGKYGRKMDAMLRELASMREAVLNKRSFDKQYRVFVKYPAGYEG